MVVLIVYSVVSIPLVVGFDLSADRWDGRWWFDAMVDLFFLSDIVISFFTAYAAADGELVRDRRAIATYGELGDEFELIAGT